MFAWIRYGTEPNIKELFWWEKLPKHMQDSAKLIELCSRAPYLGILLGIRVSPEGGWHVR